MTTEPSPRPWRAEQPGDECRFWTIRNPDGVSVCTAWREADAALIVDAVNERERLRDIVRRLLMLRRGDIAVPIDMEKQILAEARAAIGEDAR